MVSVTPDISASSSFQAPPPRAKADPQPSGDGFASLVDSNTTAVANNNDRSQDRAQDAAPQPAADRRPPPRRDDAAAADKPRDANSGRTDRNDASEDVAAADQASADKPAEAGSNKRAKTKSAGKAEGSKAAEKPSSDQTDAADSTETEAAADQTSSETADAVMTALPIAVAIGPDVQAPSPPPAATHAPGTAPLAIAAAALAAASTALAEAAGTPATPAANGNTTNNAAATEVKATTLAAAGDQVPTTTQLTPGSETSAAGAIAVTGPAVRQAAPKTTAPKPSASTGEAAASSAESDDATTSGETRGANTTTTAIASGAEQPIAAKPNVGNVRTEAAKTESAGAQTHTLLNPAGHQDTAPVQTNVQTNAGPSAPAFQPLLQTTAAQSPSSFTVTPAAQSAAVPLSGLAMEIAASVRSGKSRFDIRLDPAELGRIDVRIDVDRNGQVTSHLTVEKPETLSMLRQDAQQLQRALNDAGLSTGDSGLQFSLRDQSSSGQQNQSNPNAQRLILAEEETVPAVVAGSYGRMLGGSGGVDIRV